MRFKQCRDNQKGQYRTHNWLKKSQQKTYGLSIETDIEYNMDTLFDKYKILHALPRIGQKVKYTKPTTIHWFTSTVENEKDLVLGQEYTVRDTELNSSSTYIWLEEFPSTNGDERGNKQFTVGSFSWEKTFPTPEELVGYNVRDLFRLQHSFDNVQVNHDTFELWKDGSLHLSPIYDKNTGNITGFNQCDYRGADED